MNALLSLLSTKSGWRTSEFRKSALALLFSALVAVHAIPLGLAQKYAWTVQLGAIIAVALIAGIYALSRAHVKASAFAPSKLITDLLDAIRDPGSTQPTIDYAKSLLAQITSALPPVDDGRLTTLEGQIESRFRDVEAAVANWNSKVVDITPPSTSPVVPAVPVVTGDGTVDSGPGGWPAGVAVNPVPVPATSASGATTVIAPPLGPF